MPPSCIIRGISAFLLLGLLATGCARHPASTADVPRLAPQSWRISVAPFTQPRDPSQLVTGQIPQDQGIIPRDALDDLDMDLRNTLMAKTGRQYVFIPPNHLPRDWTSVHSTGQPSALSRWIEYGQKHDAQYLLVPQVLDWHEREGSQAGVTSAAHARLEFYLLNIAGGVPVGRSIYEERQVGLIDNLLTVADFVKRRGQWVTARELAGEGMLKAIGELGL